MELLQREGPSSNSLDTHLTQVSYPILNVNILVNVFDFLFAGQ